MRLVDVLLAVVGILLEFADFLHQLPVGAAAEEKTTALRIQFSLFGAIFSAAIFLTLSWSLLHFGDFLKYRIREFVKIIKRKLHFFSVCDSWKS